MVVVVDSSAAAEDNRDCRNGGTVFCLFAFEKAEKASEKQLLVLFIHRMQIKDTKLLPNFEDILLIESLMPIPLPHFIVFLRIL